MDIARRFLAAFLIAVLSLFTVACNGDDGGGGEDVEAEEGENGEDD